MSDKPAEVLTIVAAPRIGFYVAGGGRINGEYGLILAAFTTLDEALRYVGEEMRIRPESPPASKAYEWHRNPAEKSWY